MMFLDQVKAFRVASRAQYTHVLDRARARPFSVRSAGAAFFTAGYRGRSCFATRMNNFMKGNEILRRAKRLAPIFGVAIVGVSLSIFSWSYVSTLDEGIALQRFNQDATDNTQILRNGLNEYSNKLVAISSLFSAAQHDLTRAEFVAFSGTLFKDQPAILGLSWVPRVTRDQRLAHEEAARRDGIIDYHIRDADSNGSLVIAPEKDEYLPIYYSTKEAPNSKLYGFDLHDGGLRQRTFESARDQNRIVASQEFMLRSGAGDRRGFIVAVPIFRRGYPVNTLEERRQNVDGYVLGVFQIGQMIDTILTNVAPPLDVYLFEANAAPADMPVFVRSSRLRSTPAPTISLAELNAAPHWSGDVSTSGKHWTVIAPIPIGMIGGSHDRAWLIAGAVVLLTGMIMALMWSGALSARRLEKLARTDPLTGLANRLVFNERLAATFASSRRTAAEFAVHFIDLDGFKDVNDSLGHSVGDLVLRSVSLRLKSVIRETDVLARFGGDEFAVLQLAPSDSAAAAALAMKIRNAMALPFAIEGNDVTVTASIGIAMYSVETDTPDSMMIQADLALYRAKDSGRHCFRFHSGELDQQMQSRLILAEDLRGGIERGELELYYQPQVEIASGRIQGLEALVRWNSPKRGLVEPSSFIPIAESSALIQRLGSWVFNAACTQLKQWEDEGIAPQTLAVNVSGMQIKRADELVRDITDSLERWKIAPSRMELELTETVLMEATQKYGDAIERLQAVGLHIAIDDFGTGYSSLKYLTIFPVRKLKIAQELIFHVTENLRNAAVVKAAIRLAHELGIAVIAEGVETEAQAKFLTDAGCDQAQGYLFSRPVDARTATQLLRYGTGKNISTLPRIKSPALVRIPFPDQIKSGKLTTAV